MTFLTEADAREQVCPFIRVPVANNEQLYQMIDNRLVPMTQRLERHQNCQASACGMGWRWKSVFHSEQNGGVDIPMPHGNAVGYCGLVGRP